jgi:DNA-binding NarL/FixJ family response regulator
VIRIVLADDHPVVRHGLRALLRSDGSMEVVGEAGTGLEAAQAVQRLKPDVLVLDLMMGDVSGIGIIKQVSKRSPDTAVVILSMYGNDCYVMEAMQAGAMAYVLKDSPSDELVRAVKEAAAGRRYLAPPLSDRAIEAYMLKAQDKVLDPYDMLSAREREVLNMVARGDTSSQVADKLCISPRTVEVHRARVMQKLGLKNRTELIHFAMRRGILPEV